MHIYYVEGIFTLAKYWKANRYIESLLGGKNVWSMNNVTKNETPL